jgi:hypothetical protein
MADIKNRHINMKQLAETHEILHGGNAIVGGKILIVTPEGLEEATLVSVEQRKDHADTFIKYTQVKYGDQKFGEQLKPLAFVEKFIRRGGQYPLLYLA